MDYEKKYKETPFKTKLAEYLQNNSPKDGQYVISSESILEMAKEELIKRGELQKPAEWSEEDERILKGIIGKIDHNQTYGVSKVEMLSFLKSLSAMTNEMIMQEQLEEVLLIMAEKGLIPYKDGNQWCILLGENIQEGICGFGYTIIDAMMDFYREATAEGIIRKEG